MRRSGSHSHSPTFASDRIVSRTGPVYILETLQRQLATQELNDSDSDMDNAQEEKRSVSSYYSSDSTTITPTSALCRFFVLGKCRYGSRCTFSHTLPAHVSECAADESESLSAAAALVDCPFFLRGNCKFGEHCRLRHNPAILSGAAAAAAATSCSAPKAARTATYDDDKQQDFTCGICFDDIVQSGKHFGLLSCDHCFCLDCLRSWRQSKDMELVRACPACRLPSDYIVPSLIFCIGEEKRKAVEAYKSHLALRECKYFNGLFGSCPFGPRCFYAHRDGEGRDVKHLDRPKRSTKSRRGRNGRQGGDSTLHSLLQQYSHIYRFLEVADWDDFDLVGDMYDSDDSDDSDEDYFEYVFSEDDYDTE